MRPGRRLHRHRKLGRPAPKRKPESQDILLGIPVDPDDPSLSEESTLIEAESVAAPGAPRPSPAPRLAGPAPQPSPPSTQDDTVELLALPGRPTDPNEETEGALDGDLEPEPPDRIRFECPCGARLVATRKSYDKRMRCGSCRTLMLISVVYDPLQKAFEIEPLRVGDMPELGA
ncbi:MAG TPA: hypothetical protein VEN81_10170 [Planctomycetota bacterium]|nr:hypothetical protein [Planctomycetota bacterium]